MTASLLLRLITSSIERRRRFIVVIIDIKQACPRQCASYNLSNRTTLVGDALLLKIQARSSKTLKEDYKLKVIGDGPLSHHLGADYTRDKDNTLVCQPKKYIDRLVDSYHSMFKQDPPKNMRTPLDKNDHPELDDTELVTGESIQHYLTMVGQLQWLVTLGRFDIQAQVITMSRFRSAPREGHLERLQRIYGYVLCRILGLQPLIPLLQYVNRLGFEICSVNRTRKLGYVNLNWPRYSAQVTESLVLADGSFCQKQNTLYFRLCKSCEFMMCILIVDHQFNRMHPWCSWECMLPGRCSPGKRCHTFWNGNIVLLPILLGQVSCVPATTLCELYGVKFWEGLA